MSKRSEEISLVLASIDLLKNDKVSYMVWRKAYHLLDNYEISTLPNDLYWNLANSIVNANVSFDEGVDSSDVGLFYFMMGKEDIDRRRNILISHIDFIQECYNKSNDELDKNAALCAIFINNRENELTKAQREVLHGFINTKYNKQYTMSGFNLSLPTIGMTDDSKYVVGLSDASAYVNCDSNMVYKRIELVTPSGIKQFASDEELNEYLLQQTNTSEEKGAAKR